MSVRKVLMKFSRVIPDKVFINIKFFKFFGHFVDFKNPKTYNEKLQWLKIYNRDPLYPQIRNYAPNMIQKRK